MKNVFSFFGFTSLLMLSIAFTPAEKTSSEAAMGCTGEIGACVVSFVTPGADVTINIYEEGTTNLVHSSNALSCDSDFVPLDNGKYDVIIESNINATVEYRWSFCNGTVSDMGSTAVAANGSVLVGQLEI